MEIDPWQDLDIDDSDLPSLLRPCKRRLSPSLAAGRTPPEVARRQPHSPRSISATTSCGRTIPGPAGTVQAAMLRKTLDRASMVDREDSLEFCNDEVIIPTQEYIRRAVDDTAEFDDDFSRPPWLSAVRFIGNEDSVTDIGSLKKHLDAGKVNQVVAVIKSCTPSGLGGLKVTLKDHTGSVGATVHPKVLSESELGKNISVGAVLILHKVAIFSPTRTAIYLNITLRNVVKVFCQHDSHPILDESMYPLQNNVAAVDYGNNSKTWEKSIMQKVTMEDPVKELTREARSTEPSHTHIAIQKQNLFLSSFQPRNRDLFTRSVTLTKGHEHLGYACSKTPEDVLRTKLTVDQQDNASGRHKCANVGNSGSSLLCNLPTPFQLVTNSRNEEIQENDVLIERQPLMEKSFVPQWTDEQLDELFAGEEYDEF